MNEEIYPERIDPLNEGISEGITIAELTKKSHLKRYKLAKRLVSGKILDAGSGCGYGSNIIAQSPIVESVTGVEKSKDAVEYSIKRYSNDKVEFIEGDCEILADMFPENMFDNVVSFEVIEHLKNPDRFLYGVHKILKEGKSLLISTPMKKHSKCDGYGKPSNIHHIQEFSNDEMLQMLNESGFKIKSIYSQEIMIAPIIEMLKSIKGISDENRRIKNSYKRLWNRIPQTSSFLSHPYRCPEFIRKTARYSIYLAQKR